MGNSQSKPHILLLLDTFIIVTQHIDNLKWRDMDKTKTDTQKNNWSYMISERITRPQIIDAQNTPQKEYLK